MFKYNDSRLKNRCKNLRNNMPKPEQILWYWMRGKNLKGYKFRRQHSVGYYILDFYCPELRLAIEIDGDSHYSADGQAYDKERDNFLNGNNIKVIRFTNKEIIENIDGVIEQIEKFLP